MQSHDRPLKYCLIISCAPEDKHSVIALNFAKALLAKDHILYRVFFSNDGVLHASSSADHGSTQWKLFFTQFSTDAVCCSNAVSALLTSPTAENSKSTSLTEPFCLGGVAQLIDATQQCDRVIQFGTPAAS